MGWSHPAISAFHTNEILSMQRALMKDDMMRSNLIKVTLAIKNGLSVNIGKDYSFKLFVIVIFHPSISSLHECAWVFYY